MSEGSWIAIIISAIALVGNILVIVLSKKYETKKALFTTIMEQAYKEFEYKSNKLLEFAKGTEQSVKFSGFTNYVIYYSKLLKLLSKGRYSDRALKKAILEAKKASDICSSLYDKYTMNRG